LKRLIPVVCGVFVLGLAALAADTKPDPKPDAKVPKQLFVQVVNPTPTWKVSVEVDRKDKTYKLGDAVQIRVRSEREGHLYVFNLDPDGSITLLYPNDTQKETMIPANTDIMIPPANSKDRISVGEPVGKELIKAVVTTKPLVTGKLEELNKGIKKSGPYTPLAMTTAKRLFYETMTGQQSGGNPNQTLQEDVTNYQQQSPEQYKEKQREWVAVDLEITTVGKGPPDKPDQDKPKPPDKPNQDTPKKP